MAPVDAEEMDDVLSTSAPTHQPGAVEDRPVRLRSRRRRRPRCSSRCCAPSARTTRRPTCGPRARLRAWPRTPTPARRRKSGDPYITHPLAVATILAELGMTAPTLAAALLHDTVEDTGVHPRRSCARTSATRSPTLVDGVTKLDKVKYGDAAAGRDLPQDGRGDGARHPRPRHQARRPAAQHAHLALRCRRRSRSARRARPSRSTRRWPTGSA